MALTTKVIAATGLHFCCGFHICKRELVASPDLRVAADHIVASSNQETSKLHNTGYFEEVDNGKINAKRRVDQPDCLGCTKTMAAELKKVAVKRHSALKHGIERI